MTISRRNAMARIAAAAIPTFHTSGACAAPRMEELKRAFAPCDAFLPGERGYDQRTQIFHHDYVNAPRCVVAPRSAEAAEAAFKTACSMHSAVSIRSGGHGTAASAIRTGSILLDTRSFSSISISSSSREVTVRGGALTADLDAACRKRGLVLPTGFCPGVGVMGYVLGGGLSELGHALGYAVDRVVALTLVTPSGDTLVVKPESKYFGALMGAGAGNFGLVNAITLRAEALPDNLTAGHFEMSLKSARDMLHLIEQLQAEPAEAQAVLHLSVPSDGRVQLVVDVVAWSQSDDGAFWKQFSKAGQRGKSTIYRDYFSYKANGDKEMPKSASAFRAASFLRRPITPDLCREFGDLLTDAPSSASIDLTLETLGGKLRTGTRWMGLGHRHYPALMSLFCFYSSEEEAAVVAEWSVDLIRNRSDLFAPGNFPNYYDKRIESLLQLQSGGSHSHTARRLHGSKWNTLVEIKKHLDPRRVITGIL